MRACMSAAAILRSLLHSLLLAIIDFFSILVGFSVFKLVSQSNQIAVQAPIAVACAVGLFAVWSRLAYALGGDSLRMQGWKNGGWVLALSLIWAPILFVPLHFFTQGYLTSFGNVLALWAFQLAANPIAVGVALSVVGKRTAGCTGVRTGSSSAL